MTADGDKLTPRVATRGEGENKEPNPFSNTPPPAARPFPPRTVVAIPSIFCSPGSTRGGKEAARNEDRRISPNPARDDMMSVRKTTKSTLLAQGEGEGEMQVGKRWKKAEAQESGIAIPTSEAFQRM